MLSLALNLWLHTYFLPNKNNKHVNRLSFGGGQTTHPDQVVTTASLTLLAGLATLDRDSRQY